MSYSLFASVLPWQKYSKKLTQKIQAMRYVGFFSSQEAEERGMRLAVEKKGNKIKADRVDIYLLVDESDGVIADAKFQAFGPSALIGAAEAACELLMRKTYDQALRLTAELIDKQVRDKPEIPAFPQESFSYLNIVLEALFEAAEQCLDIVCPQNDIPTPIDMRTFGDAKGYHGWAALNKERKIALIEEVIAQDIRPYIELDAGGVEVIDLLNEKELMIAYQGACTSCYSATGSTLQAIQEILRAKLDPHLVVIPDSSFLK